MSGTCQSIQSPFAAGRGHVFRQHTYRCHFVVKPDPLTIRCVVIVCEVDALVAEVARKYLSCCDNERELFNSRQALR